MAQVTDRFVEYATDVMVLGKAINGGTIVSLVTDRKAMREVRESHVRIGRTDQDRKSTRLNSSHIQKSRMPSSA